MKTLDKDIFEHVKGLIKESENMTDKFELVETFAKTFNIDTSIYSTPIRVDRSEKTITLKYRRINYYFTLLGGKFYQS